MEVVILCGGKGTRLRPVTEEIPKPMVTVADKPVLWHIMNKYASHGHKDFILCLGYKADVVKEYFDNDDNKGDGWNVVCVDTGEDSNKGERLFKVKDHIKGDEFLLAYGDDISNVDIGKIIEYHNERGKIVTLTAIRPISQFGVMELENGDVTDFKEKPKLGVWINGGFYVIKKKIFDYLVDGADFESDALKKLAEERQISAYKHDGFWMCMNTQKDAEELDKILRQDGNSYLLK